jgi:hypothetical protein
MRWLILSISGAIASRPPAAAKAVAATALAAPSGPKVRQQKCHLVHDEAHLRSEYQGERQCDAPHMRTAQRRTLSRGCTEIRNDWCVAPDTNKQNGQQDRQRDQHRQCNCLAKREMLRQTCEQRCDRKSACARTVQCQAQCQATFVLEP